MDRLLRAVLEPAPRDTAGDCPDAGVLAAFVGGNLTATEQSALDAHIAACGRCQEALAILSHDLPEVEDEIVAAPESGWFTWVTQPRLRWLVPISVAATVAVIFFATRPLIAPEGELPVTEVARMAQAPAPPAELPAAGAEAPREKSSAMPEKSESAGPPGRRETARALADVAPPGERARDKKAAEPAAELMAARVASEEKRTPPAAPAAPPPPAGGQPAAAQHATNVPAAAAPRLDEELHRLKPLALVRAAPDGRVQWRLGPGGRIWRSTDAGSTWHWQLSGVSANLVAGSAPSATTCWAVGDAGIVLLTEDGQRWTLLPFPMRVDLAAVHAIDSRIATVTTRDGRRFETLDAGRTWSPKQ
jgi:hypothetical protein